jgi:hypothetical protein
VVLAPGIVAVVELLSALSYPFTVTSIGSGALTAALSLIAVGVDAGYLLGGPGPDTRRVVDSEQLMAEQRFHQAAGTLSKATS